MQNEFPKALYLEGVHLTVKDADEEAAARAEGYDDWAVDHERSKPAPAKGGKK